MQSAIVELQHLTQPTSVIQHVHLEVRAVDEALVARRAFDFTLRFMVADGVKLQRALCFEEHMALMAFVRFVRAVCVLKLFTFINVAQLLRPVLNSPCVFADSMTLRSI